MPPCPVVEIAHERDALRVRRPDGEAVPRRAGERVAAERAVSVRGRAGVKFLQLRLRDGAGARPVLSMARLQCPSLAPSLYRARHEIPTVFCCLALTTCPAAAILGTDRMYLGGTVCLPSITLISMFSISSAACAFTTTPSGWSRAHEGRGRRLVPARISGRRTLAVSARADPACATARSRMTSVRGSSTLRFPCRIWTPHTQSMRPWAASALKIPAWASTSSRTRTGTGSRSCREK